MLLDEEYLHHVGRDNKSFIDKECDTSLLDQKKVILLWKIFEKVEVRVAHVCQI